MTTHPLRITAALATCSALLLTACGGGNESVSGNDIRIGLLTDQTGPAATFGIPERDAILFLAARSNKSGGIAGRKVTVIAKDGKTNPTESAKAARELISNDKVHVIIGPTTGSAALAVGPVAASGKVPVLAPVGTIDVTKSDSGFFEWMYRTSVNDRQGVDAALELAKNRGYKRIGVFYQQDAYGEASTSYLKQAAPRHGGLEVVGEASAALTASDAAAQATKLKGDNPDVIVVQASSATAAGSFVRSLRQAGSQVPVIVAAGLTARAFLDAAGPAAESALAAAGVGWDTPTPTQSEFIASYGQPKNFGEAIAGTAYLAIETAIGKVQGELTGTSLRDALDKTCPFPTLQRGDGCFSAKDHDGALKGVPVQVTNGAWVTVK